MANCRGEETLTPTNAARISRAVAVTATPIANGCINQCNHLERTGSFGLGAVKSRWGGSAVELPNEGVIFSRAGPYRLPGICCNSLRKESRSVRISPQTSHSAKELSKNQRS